MLALGHQFVQVQSGGRLDPVVQFLFGVLPVGEAFDLEDDDVGQAVEVEFAPAGPEGYVWQQLYFCT